MKNLIAGIALMAMCGSALSGPLEDGIAAFDASDYVTAMRCCGHSQTRATRVPNIGLASCMT